MASRLQDVILRGLAADRPLAPDVAPGTLYYSSDTQVTERCSDDNLSWETYSDTSSGGMPGAHATTHEDGGSDPVDIKDLPGYTGSPLDFLRGDATFAPITRLGSVGLIIDGGPAVITTGLKGFLEIPFACTIQAVTLLADQIGSIVIDIWKDTYANFPPVVADTITAGAKPTIVAGIKSQDTTLTGWTVAIAAGDILAFNVDSVVTIQKVTLSLKIQVA